MRPRLIGRIPARANAAEKIKTLLPKKATDHGRNGRSGRFRVVLFARYDRRRRRPFT